MTAFNVLIWVLTAFAPQTPAPQSTFHIAVETRFNYMALARSSSTEIWSAPGKTATSLGDRLIIKRDDLGVRWTVNVKANTYTEQKIAPPPPQPPRATEDIHTAGFDYEPDYDWTLRESGQAAAIAGRPCRQFVASGDADYAEATVTFSLCEPIPGVTYAVNDAVLVSLRSPSARKMVLDQAAKLGNRWVLAVEELQEPAIATTMTNTVTVKALETTEAPAARFEVPPGAKKIGSTTTFPEGTVAYGERSMPVIALVPLGQPARQLPPAVLRELNVIEETCVLLDQVAEKIWPGWTGYRDWPFMFTFENGLKVLVGHPNPPKPFEVVEQVQVGGRAVAADFSAVTPLPLNGPFAGGGGVLPFGMTSAGAPVTLVDIKLRMPRAGEKATAGQGPTAETKILVYLHELFHCFQRSFKPAPGNNLMYNADIDYATWSNVEGIALDRAYGEGDPAAARERLEEFLVARSLKRRSMTDMQRRQESWGDVIEGTANYAMVRALEVIKAGGFRPQLTASDNPEYHGFANVDAMLADYRKGLATAAAMHDYPAGKSYQYGCFQGLVCQRLFPGWQSRVQKGEYLDAILSSNVPIAESERPQIEQRLNRDYPIAAIRADAAKSIEPRDLAWNQFKTRAGRTYIIDVKRTGQAVNALVRSAPAGTPGPASYTLGLMKLFPVSFPGFTLDAIEMSPAAVPALTDELYYVKVVDTEPGTRKQPYTVQGTKQADGTWINATVTTPLFTLKAPHLRIRETGMRVKIQVLARVAGTA